MKISDASRTLNSLDCTRESRWCLPFPMGVFGTLRHGQWNNRRMHCGLVAEHRKAFMPHFVANGLSITFNKGSSAPFEIFAYDDREWPRMIPGVDALEGFQPPSPVDSRPYGYFRTLAWLRLLPDDYEHQLFTRPHLGGLRDLRVPEDTWEQYERVPCWVYSSRTQNERAKGCDTVIWG